MAKAADHVYLEIKELGFNRNLFTIPKHQNFPIMKSIGFSRFTNCSCNCVKIFEGFMTAFTTDPSVVVEVMVFQIDENGDLRKLLTHKQNAFEGVRFSFEGCCRENDLLKDCLKFLINVKIWQEADNQIYLQFFNSESLSDFSIICSDGVAIPAHKVVLAANSSEIKKVMEFPSNPKPSSLHMEYVDSETMMEALRFMYCGNVENIKENAKKLVFFAVQYEVEKLKKFCEVTMVHDVSTENVMEYRDLAYRLKLDSLVAKCLEFSQKDDN